MRPYFENHDYNIRVLDEANFNFPSAHWHTKLELAFVLDGDIWVGANNEKKLLRKGDAVFLGSGDIHYYDGRNSNKARLLILIFKSELINASPRWPENIRILNHYLLRGKFPSEELSQLKELTYLVKDETEKNDPASPLLIKSYLFKICGILLRQLPTVAIDNPSEKRINTRLMLLQNIFSYIESNYMDDITAVSISKRYNMSLKYFSKVFNSISNVNFKTHLNSIRIKNAESMIAEGKYSLAEIAFECGFNSVRTFNRAFREIKGEAPSSMKHHLPGNRVHSEDVG